MSIFKSDMQMPDGIEGSVSSAMLPGEHPRVEPKLPGFKVEQTMSTHHVDRPRRGHDM